MELADEGNFFVGGQVVRSEYPGVPLVGGSDARDELHRHSKLSSAVRAVICGLGPYGYIVAMQAALHMLEKLPASLSAPIRVGLR